MSVVQASLGSAGGVANRRVAFPRRERVSRAGARPLALRPPRRPVTAAAASPPDGDDRPPEGPGDTPPPPSTTLADLLDSALLPRSRGDARDCALMAAAVAGLVWASMGATRAYCAAYAAAGFRPLGRVLVEFLAGGGGGGAGGPF